jgi:hypothetical protein
MCSARHRERDRAVDDRTYWAFGGNVNENILQHDNSPRILRIRPPLRFCVAIGEQKCIRGLIHLNPVRSPATD